MARCECGRTCPFNFFASWQQKNPYERGGERGGRKGNFEPEEEKKKGADVSRGTKTKKPG